MAGPLSHKVDFPSNIETTHFRFFTETLRRVPKAYVKEVVLGTDTDPLVEGPDFSVCQQLSLQRRLSTQRPTFESSSSAYGAKLRSIRHFRMYVDWQRECFCPRGVTRTVEGSTNGPQLTTHREREKYPWIAKARAGTESPSTKLLRVRRNRIISCGFRAVETGKLWMICLLLAAHTSIRQPFAFFRILMMRKMPYKTACCARFGT